MEVEPVGKYEWLDLMLRLRVPPQRKAVAQAMAFWAKKDGTSVRPGQQKVADMANIHVSKAGPHIRALRDAGLLKLVKAGGGRGGAPDLYRLSRPVDISVLPLWLDPDMDRYPAGSPTEELHRPPTVDVPAPAGDGPDKEYRPPTVGETGPADDGTAEEWEPSEVGESSQYRPPTVGIDDPADPVDNPEHRPDAVGENGGTPTASGLNSPVDNSKHRPFRSETPTVSGRNTDRRRSTNTLRTPQEHLLGSPQATNSLGDTGRTEPPTPIDAMPNGHPRSLAAAFLDGEETAVRGETAVDRAQTLAEVAAARRVLDHLPDREEWLNRARTELAARDRPSPSVSFVTVVAAELHRRATQPTSEGAS